MGQITDLPPKSCAFWPCSLCFFGLFFASQKQAGLCTFLHYVQKSSKYAATFFWPFCAWANFLRKLAPRSVSFRRRRKDEPSIFEENRSSKLISKISNFFRSFSNFFEVRNCELLFTFELKSSKFRTSARERRVGTTRRSAVCVRPPPACHPLW